MQSCIFQVETIGDGPAGLAPMPASLGKDELYPKKGTGAFVISFCAGVRPGSRGPFVSAKGPKTIVAVAWPFGCPTSFADFGGAQTRYAQTMRAFPRIRLHDLASPQGHGIPMMP
ncbi:MAG TPA: hypothetical protein VLA60_01835 [Nitrospirales bacterium]|nr:hypothetical protein [Nitrospirales bacterium]